MLPIKLKPGDIVKVKLAGDVYTVEVVKVNPKTFLANMTQTKTRYRKVRKDTTGQMNLFDAVVENVKRYVKVPYTITTKKLVKLPKGKLVSIEQSAGRVSDTDSKVEKVETLIEKPLNETPIETPTETPMSALDEMLASIKK